MWGGEGHLQSDVEAAQQEAEQRSRIVTIGTEPNRNPSPFDQPVIVKGLRGCDEVHMRCMLRWPEAKPAKRTENQRRRPLTTISPVISEGSYQ